MLLQEFFLATILNDGITFRRQGLESADTDDSVGSLIHIEHPSLYSSQTFV